MMNGEECRSNAKRARETAMMATDPAVRTAWTDVAVEWLRLAGVAEAQAILEKALLSRDAG
jgi:hypothetical protein